MKQHILVLYIFFIGMLLACSSQEPDNLTPNHTNPTATCEPTNPTATCKPTNPTATCEPTNPTATCEPTNPAPCTNSAPIAWPNQIIYFVLLDRFYNGDPQNDYQPSLEDKKYPYHKLLSFCGGDVQGLIQKLPYLKQLGITTIWVSPVFDNPDARFFDRWAYHGYWVQHFTRAEERLTNYEKAQKSLVPANRIDQTEKLYGDIETLQKLSQAIHEQGMYFMFDMVINHCDYNAPLLKGDKKDGAHPEWFHPYPDIDDWNNPFQILNYRVHGLPDLAQENPEVADYLIKVSKLWIQALRPDAFRLDAVKHVPIEFWAKYNQAIRSEKSLQDFFMMGEYYDGYGRTCTEIQRQANFSGMIDFPLYFQISKVIGEEHSATNFGQVFNYDLSYHDPNLLGTFLDNHDTPRFMTAMNNDTTKFKLGLTFLFAVRGIPTLYYGTEIGMTGLEEKYDPEYEKNRPPENRKEMNFDLQDTQAKEIFAYTQKLIQLRRNSNALTQGIQIHLAQAQNMYAFARVANEQVALVVFNNSREVSNYSIPLHLLAQSLPNGQVDDVLEQQVSGMIKDNQLVVSLPAKTCSIFLISGNFSKDFAYYQEWRKNPGTIPVTFTVTLPQAVHNNIAVIGESSALGNWNPRQAYLLNRMSPTLKNTYSVTLPMKKGTIISFKYIQNCPEQDDQEQWKKQHGQEEWELGYDNRCLEIPWEGTCEIKAEWNKK